MAGVRRRRRCKYRKRVAEIQITKPLLYYVWEFCPVTALSSLIITPNRCFPLVSDRGVVSEAFREGAHWQEGKKVSGGQWR